MQSSRATRLVINLLRIVAWTLSVVLVLSACARESHPTGKHLYAKSACQVQPQRTAVTNASFWGWLYSNRNAAAFATELDESATHTLDDLVINFEGASNFVGPAAENGSSRALYDDRNHIVALCFDDAKSRRTTVEVISGVFRPHFPIATHGLSRVATQRGIQIGSGFLDLKRVYGNGFLRKEPVGQDLVAYEEWLPMRKGWLEISIAFVLNEGPVVAISRSVQYFDRKPPPSRDG